MKKFLILLVIFFLFLSSKPIFATEATGQGSSGSSGGVTLTDPLGFNGNPQAPQLLIKNIIQGALGIVGSLALIMFIYGGFTWMFAAGNSDAVVKGRNILIWAAIGLVIIFSSYALVNFVFTKLLSNSPTTSQTQTQ